MPSVPKGRDIKILLNMIISYSETFNKYDDFFSRKLLTPCTLYDLNLKCYENKPQYNYDTFANSL